MGKSTSSENGAGLTTKAAYATPKLTAYGNINELTGGPSSGTSDGKSPGAMAMM